MENVAPWLPVVALGVLVAVRRRLAQDGLVAGSASGWSCFVVALAVGFIVGSPEPDCEDGLCTEYLPFFIGLFLEIALGAVAVLLAVIAVIVRAARAA